MTATRRPKLPQYQGAALPDPIDKTGRVEYLLRNGTWKNGADLTTEEYDEVEQLTRAVARADAPTQPVVRRVRLPRLPPTPSTSCTCPGSAQRQKEAAKMGAARVALLLHRARFWSNVTLADLARVVGVDEADLAEARRRMRHEAR